MDMTWEMDIQYSWSFTVLLAAADYAHKFLIKIAHIAQYEALQTDVQTGLFLASPSDANYIKIICVTFLPLLKNMFISKR